MLVWQLSEAPLLVHCCRAKRVTVYVAVPVEGE
jgi:hypothetical protein